ncbi:MAG TPA: putative porin [Pyrinomonadaceae bacterium]|nr:putative porin [Pyrinomonadaceae bacterium]
MLTKSGSNFAKAFVLALVAWSFFALSVAEIRAQNIAQPNSGGGSTAAVDLTRVEPSAPKKPETLEEKLSALQQSLERLQKTVEQQQETIRLLALQLHPSDSSTVTAAIRVEPISDGPQTPSVEDRLKKVESSVSQLGSIKFSGDIRLRSESIFGQSNMLASAANPLAFGNALTPRHRMRLRARLTMRGSVNEEFDWGLRLATGSMADNISTNQTLTDFFNRKPFALDQAFITYKPRKLPGLRLQGGRFEPPWTATEMTIDQDLMVDGFNESYSLTRKHSVLKDVTFVAWQLPMLERNSAFVRNADGTVNVEQSRRGGRDLALYGGQLRTRFEPSSKVALNLSIADLYFSGTQLISPVQVFGSLLQLPVIVSLPGGGTVTSQALIPRDLLVGGNGNLGLTTASNNATNRDGRLSSGFNLVDLIARLELKHSKRFPVAVIANFVTNTQTHDVVTALGTTEIILPNHENNGLWAEVQVGKTQAKGDMQFGYTFMRIEKDAVLTPFNFSDVTQQSDMRGHKFGFSYAADPRVVFTVTGIITERLRGLLGPFVPTPPGSLNRPTTRLQLDTVLKF